MEFARRCNRDGCENDARASYVTTTFFFLSRPNEFCALRVSIVHFSHFQVVAFGQNDDIAGVSSVECVQRSKRMKQNEQLVDHRGEK